MSDIEGAILAYDQLLRLEPPFAPGQSSAVAVKRGVQELVLLSHRRGLEDARLVQQNLRENTAAQSARVVLSATPPTLGLYLPISTSPHYPVTLRSI
jgi:hypothetical protein